MSQSETSVNQVLPTQDTEIVNRVANSGLITFDLEDYYPELEIVELDIQPWLYKGFAVKEEEFRAFVKAHNWQQYAGKGVAVKCSIETIIPNWAYMLVATELSRVTNAYFLGLAQDLLHKLMLEQLNAINLEDYHDKRVVVKGCGKKDVPASMYVEISRILVPVVKSLMFGEPCSTVPVFKKK